MRFQPLPLVKHQSPGGSRSIVHAARPALDLESHPSFCRALCDHAHLATIGPTPSSPGGLGAAQPLIRGEASFNREVSRLGIQHGVGASLRLDSVKFMPEIKLLYSSLPSSPVRHAPGSSAYPPFCGCCRPADCAANSRVLGHGRDAGQPTANYQNPVSSFPRPDGAGPTEFPPCSRIM